MEDIFELIFCIMVVIWIPCVMYCASSDRLNKKF